MQMEIRDLLTKYGFPGDKVPIVRGAGKPAYDHPADPDKTKCIADLLDKVDSYISGGKKLDETATIPGLDEAQPVRHAAE